MKFKEIVFCLRLLVNRSMWKNDGDNGSYYVLGFGWVFYGGRFVYFFEFWFVIREFCFFIRLFSLFELCRNIFRMGDIGRVFF